MKSFRSSDKNFFFNVRRENLQNPLLRGNTFPTTVHKSKVLNIEAIDQPYPSVVGKGDKNFFFRRKKSLMPTLPQRVIKDLEPQSRVIGSLAITKEDRQAKAVVSGIENIADQLKNFMKTPKVKPDGTPILDLTGRPEFEQRSLGDLVRSAQEGLHKVFRDNDIPIGADTRTIINNFTSDQSLNILNRMRDVLIARPTADKADKARMFFAILITEATTDLTGANQNFLGHLTNTIVRQNYPNTWDAYAPTLFRRHWISPVQYNAWSPQDKSELNIFLITRINFLGQPILNVAGDSTVPMTNIPKRFATRASAVGGGGGPWLDLVNLRFRQATVPNIPMAQRAFVH